MGKGRGWLEYKKRKRPKKIEKKRKVKRVIELPNFGLSVIEKSDFSPVD